eukprot:INCI15464.1.p1 GENE.INCI15464.1~~INCI15464.1.p1  ORF type:complete len:1531 (+),score=238.79 INCI15464.1:3380-7972(+)
MSSAIFDRQKTDLLRKLDQAIDKSPKGFIDLPVVDLVNDFNSSPDYVTTSSCSGRICLFESHSSDRGKGGRWLLVNHRLTPFVELKDTLLLAKSERRGADQQAAGSDSGVQQSQVFLKHEPMILHVMCRNLDAARRLLHVALSVGFRESGIVVGRSKHMVHIRTTSNSLSTPVADATSSFNGDGKDVLPGTLVSEQYLQYLSGHVNDLFRENEAKIRKLYSALSREGIFRVGIEEGSRVHGSVDAANKLELECCRDPASSGTSRVAAGSVPTSAWQMAGAHTQGICSRWGHSYVPVHIGSKSSVSLVFGGYGQPTKDASTTDCGTQRLNSVVCLEPTSTSPSGCRGRGEGGADLKARVVDCGGLAPSPRIFHSAASVRTILPRTTGMVVFGGRGSPASGFSDIHILVVTCTDPTPQRPATLAAQWIQPTTTSGKVPEGRWRATLTAVSPASADGNNKDVHEDHFLLLGGRGANGRIFDDAHVLKIAWEDGLHFSVVWTPVQLQDNGGSQLASLQRFSHTATVCDTSSKEVTLLVVGGFTRKPDDDAEEEKPCLAQKPALQAQGNVIRLIYRRSSNELIVDDANTLAVAVAGHTATMLTESRILFVGGVGTSRGGYCDWSKCCNSSVAPGGAASSWMVVFNWRTGASEVVSSVRSDSSFQQVESLVVDVCEPQEADAHADNQAVRAGQGESVAIVPINHSAHVSMCHVGSGRHPKYCCRLTIVGGGGHAIPFGHVFGKTAQVDFELTLENSDETADTPLSGIVRETLTGSDFIQRDFQIETASWYARGVVVPASFAKIAKTQLEQSNLLDVERPIQPFAEQTQYFPASSLRDQRFKTIRANLLDQYPALANCLTIPCVEVPAHRVSSVLLRLLREDDVEIAAKVVPFRTKAKLAGQAELPGPPATSPPVPSKIAKQRKKIAELCAAFKKYLQAAVADSSSDDVYPLLVEQLPVRALTTNPRLRQKRGSKAMPKEQNKGLMKRPITATSAKSVAFDTACAVGSADQASSPSLPRQSSALKATVDPVVVVAGACAKTVKTALEQSDLYDKKRKMAPLRGGASVFRFKNAFVNHVEGGLVVVPVNSLHAVEQAVRHWADSKDETKNPAINQSGSPAELTNSDSNPQVVLGETAGVRKKSRTRKKSKTGLVSLCEIAAHYRSFDDVAHSSKGVVEWQMACKIVFIGCSSSSECFEGAGDLPTNLRYDQPDVQFRRYLQKAFTATAGLSPDFIEKLVAPPCFPRRFEVVGDAVLIPMNAFQPEMWGKAISRAFGNAMTSDEHATSVGQRTAARSCDRESWLRFYSALANCFGARIVVQDAAIDSGYMRQSQRRILFNRASVATRSSDNVKTLSPPTTLHTGPGWVETAQHGLIFGFDITKVMFSSGNVTERKRMGHIGARPGEGGPSGQPSNDLEEVVVDLFAGIGYFTVPLLALPPRCKKLFACEINPDSVFALQQNLLRNGVVRLEGCILVKLIVARHIACELIGFVAAWVLGGSMHSACRGQCRFRCLASARHCRSRIVRIDSIERGCLSDST